MFKFLIIKRQIENVIIYFFILIGRILSYFKKENLQYRIYFFFPFYHTGGAEKVHMQIASALGGKDCIIYFTKKSSNDRFLQDFKLTGCKIIDISKYTDSKLFYVTNLILRGFLSSLINSQLTKPIVFNGQCNFAYKISPWIDSSIHQFELIHSFNSFSKIRVPYIPFIFRTIMISQKSIADHIRQYKYLAIPESYESKIRYIPNAINLPDINNKQLSEEPFIVLYVGRSTKEKRIQLILRIAVKLQAKKNIQFRLVGDIQNYDDSRYSNVKLYGNISDEKILSDLYLKAHVLILTSDTEGFPMVVIEAMASGCAILATPVGDIPLFIKNYVNGFIFEQILDEQKVVDEAVSKILWFIQHPKELRMISQNNIDFANNNFGIDQFKLRYKQIINMTN